MGYYYILNNGEKKFTEGSIGNILMERCIILIALLLPNLCAIFLRSNTLIASAYCVAYAGRNVAIGASIHNAGFNSILD